MIWQEMIMDIFDRIAGQLAEVLDGMTTEELNLQPAPDAASVGFLAWKLSRSHDMNVSEMMQEEQLWLSEGWHARFNREPDGYDTGLRFSLEDIQKFKAPDSIFLMRYHHSVLERTRDFIGSSLAETILEKESYSPLYRRRIPVYRKLTGMINDGFAFAGQAAYVRGLLHGYDWQRR